MDASVDVIFTFFFDRMLLLYLSATWYVYDLIPLAQWLMYHPMNNKLPTIAVWS